MSMPFKIVFSSRIHATDLHRLQEHNSSVALQQDHGHASDLIPVSKELASLVSFSSSLISCARK
jgi:hypothetical protein